MSTKLKQISPLGAALMDMMNDINRSTIQLYRDGSTQQEIVNESSRLQRLHQPMITHAITRISSKEITS